MARIILINFIFVSIVSGCASVKPYPVCFFDTLVPSDSIIEEQIKRLDDVIRLTSNETKTATDGYWIFAKTGWFQHRQISQSWARIACNGRVASGTEVKRYQNCINHIEMLLKTKNFSELDVKDYTPDSDEAPGSVHIICKKPL